MSETSDEKRATCGLVGGFSSGEMDAPGYHEERVFEREDGSTYSRVTSYRRKSRIVEYEEVQS